MTVRVLVDGVGALYSLPPITLRLRRRGVRVCAPVHAGGSPTFCCGSRRPNLATNLWVAAPAAQITYLHLISPFSDTTELMAPAVVSIESAPQPSAITAPNSLARLAIAGAAFFGSACPSEGV